MKRILSLSIFLLMVTMTVALQETSSDYVDDWYFSSNSNSQVTSDYNVSYGIGQLIQENLTGVSYFSQDGIFYILNTSNISEAVVVIIPPAGGGGGGGAKAITLYYDVIVNVLKGTYRPGSILDVEITLMNKGDVPDRDAILEYYLVGPNNERYNVTRKVFEEVPPFSYIGETCIKAGGSIEEQTGNCITLLSEQISLSPNSSIGQWFLYVEYETEVQPLIRVYDDFYVLKKNYMFELIIVSLLLIYFWKKKKGG